jgi:hypothetical protein
MPCRSPLQGYRKPDGSLAFGTRSETMGRFGLVTLRCGMCRDCRLYKAREWAIRCYHEGAMYERSCFLTLTFEVEPPSISKRDLQLFFKRLRKSLRGKKIRYFAVGEYGEKLGRPHYHVCLFGFDFPDKYPWRRSKKGHLLYRSPHLEKVWTAGNCDIGELTMESAGYAARYTMKKIGGDMAEQHYGDRCPEFNVCSNGLGKQWIEKYWPDVARDGFVVYKGKKCPVPGYYMVWLKNNRPEAYEKVVMKRSEYYEQETYESGERLHFAAKARDSRTKTLTRDLESGSEEYRIPADWPRPDRPF